jgi:type II secretory pathway component PulJ
MCRPRRLLRDDERGTSLIEVSFSMLLLGIVMVMFGALTSSLQNASSREEGRVRRNDEIRLALSQLDREIRSGNVLYDPATESADPTGDIVPGMTLRIYTQADAPNRNPGNQCSQWRITNDTLQTRRWSDSDPDGSVTGWWTVASNVVNRSVSPTVDAFTLDGTSSYANRVVNIALLVDRDDDLGDAQQMKLSLTGRNTQNPYRSGVCTPIPAY